MTQTDRIFVATCVSLILAEIMTSRTKSHLVGLAFGLIMFLILVGFSFILGV